MPCRLEKQTGGRKYTSPIYASFHVFMFYFRCHRRRFGIFPRCWRVPLVSRSILSVSNRGGVWPVATAAENTRQRDRARLPWWQSERGRERRDRLDSRTHCLARLVPREVPSEILSADLRLLEASRQVTSTGERHCTAAARLLLTPKVRRLIRTARAAASAGTVSENGRPWRVASCWKSRPPCIAVKKPLFL